MKIAIVSDSHDNIPNIQKFLDWINKNNIDPVRSKTSNEVEMIIHCGDLSAPAIITKELEPKFKGQIHFIHGNVADRQLAEEKASELENITCHQDLGELKIENKKIAFTHFPWDADKLAKTKKYDLIFYGHDHKPWDKQIGNTRLLNPGTLAGMFAKATFAVYDTKTDKAQLIILETI